MRTSATNRKIRVLIRAIADGSLVPRPEFQRNLVWSNRDKLRFLDTVLKGYPFPEIYIAAGSVNEDTGEGSEMLVDGQQRITTLFHYFNASPELQIRGDLRPYSDLSSEGKQRFLEYEVVVRDLGQLNMGELVEVFTRINATRYTLNAMELHNARYSGEFKAFGEDVAQDRFFEHHRVFSASEIRRMGDVKYALTLVITILSSYFNRDDELESWLQQYNDEFPQKDGVRAELNGVFAFVEGCKFPDRSRVWQGADLFTLLVEVHRAMYRHGRELDAAVCERLHEFYQLVGQGLESLGKTKGIGRPARSYILATAQATNDRSSRIARGRTIQRVLEGPRVTQRKPSSAGRRTPKSGTGDS